MDTGPNTDRVQRPDSVVQTATTEDPVLFINPRRKYKRQGTGSVSETKSDTSEDEASSTMSESEELELSALDSDVEMEDDGETGLNNHERRKFLKRKRRCDSLDSRIAGTTGISKDEAREADKNVMHNLLINAALIGLWYFFSLSISIVSHRQTVQTTGPD